MESEVKLGMESDIYNDIIKPTIINEAEFKYYFLKMFTDESTNEDIKFWCTNIAGGIHLEVGVTLDPTNMEQIDFIVPAIIPRPKMQTDSAVVAEKLFYWDRIFKTLPEVAMSKAKEVLGPIITGQATLTHEEVKQWTYIIEHYILPHQQGKTISDSTSRVSQVSVIDDDLECW